MTERLEQLRRRVSSAESLRSIAGAMKALAAVRIRGFRESVTALEDYRKALEAGFQVALRDAPGAPLGVPGDVERDLPTGLVVFGSDLGLVGQFNADIADYAVRRLEDAGEVRHVAAVGSRPVPHLRAAGVALSSVLPVPASRDHLPELAQDLLVMIEGWRREGVERVAVAHHAYRSEAHWGPRWQRLLPLDPDWLEELAGRPWPTRVIPTYRSSWESLFRFLVREHLYVSLVRAGAESQASEQAGRLAAMERAGRRIDEHLEELRASLRASRQEAITEELLDLMTGYRASGEERGAGGDVTPGRRAARGPGSSRHPVSRISPQTAGGGAVILSGAGAGAHPPTSPSCRPGNPADGPHRPRTPTRETTMKTESPTVQEQENRVRRAYREKREAQIQELAARLDLWEAKARKAKADARIRSADQIEELRGRLDDVRAKLTKLQGAGEAAWDDLKAGLDDAMDDLREAYRRASSRFE